MSRILIGCIFLFLFTGIFSCTTEKDEFFVFTQVKNGEWHKDSVLQLQLDSIPVDPRKTYSVSLELTHSNVYRYSDIWLFVGENLQDSTLRFDTVKCMLANEKGRWFGNSAGSLHQFSVPYKENLRLDSVRPYRFIVRQAMNDNPLQGIEKIGFKISETGQRKDFFSHLF